MYWHSLCLVCYLPIISDNYQSGHSHNKRSFFFKMAMCTHAAAQSGFVCFVCAFAANPTAGNANSVRQGWTINISRSYLLHIILESDFIAPEILPDHHGSCQSSHGRGDGEDTVNKTREQEWVRGAACTLGYMLTRTDWLFPGSRYTSTIPGA